MVSARVHGGPDAQGAAPHDFSTNANACGPCPVAAQALADADRARYPDPAYVALRERLAAHHGIEPGRVVVAGSGSEFIVRITAALARRGARSVGVPAQAFGDYAAAARACSLQVHAGGVDDALVWTCEPSSPRGHSDPRMARVAATSVLVCDLAYEPLRLSGTRTALPAHAWQLWTPNKALGLTGVRAAYALAPAGAEELVHELEALAPSWVVGAEGVALLQAWCAPQAQQWLEGCKPTLREWKQRQAALCERLGWTVEPSDANFFVARADLDADALAGLRRQGVQLRDCASFGLPGQVRLSVQPPAAQDALRAAVEALR
jgi:histidinol-phosphate aminotransferase